MNQKLLIILSGIALLGIGTVLLLQKHDKLNETTVDDFKYCLMKNIKDCSLISNQDERKNCKSAEFYISHLTTPACTNFSTFLMSSKSTDLLNSNEFYQQCFLSEETIARIAEISTFYLTQIYTPMYKTCVGL